MNNEVKTAYELLGFEDHIERSAKARIVMQITKAIKEKGMTQAEAGAVIGISQGKVSSLLKGNFNDFTMDRLIRLLDALGYETQISFTAKIAA